MTPTFGLASFTDTVRVYSIVIIVLAYVLQIQTETNGLRLSYDNRMSNTYDQILLVQMHQKAHKICQLILSFGYFYRFYVDPK